MLSGLAPVGTVPTAFNVFKSTIVDEFARPLLVNPRPRLDAIAHHLVIGIDSLQHDASDQTSGQRDQLPHMTPFRAAHRSYGGGWLDVTEVRMNG